MSSFVGRELRRLVAVRANYSCEYCLIHEENAYFGCEVDHVISMKHGGKTVAENLAYSCAPCNRFKGSDIASVIWETGEIIRLFNPRIDDWGEHFQLDKSIIKPISEIGIVTARLLRFNVDERVLEREMLIAFDRYPSPAALRSSL